MSEYREAGHDKQMLIQAIPRIIKSKQMNPRSDTFHKCFLQRERILNKGISYKS